MDEKRLLLRYVDDLTMISLRLGKLHCAIMSISMGMKKEKMEQQAIDNMDCVGYCVSDIRNMILDRLQQMEKPLIRED